MFYCYLHPFHLLLVYELVFHANRSESAGQDRASFSSPYSVGSPNPLPVDQQQTVPNARSVPPAIAGHTSPKPSAATPGLVTTSRHSLASLLLICHLWLWLFC